MYDYKSPIQVFRTQMVMEQEKDLVMKVSQTVGYEIDKEELIQALRYDRNQYDRGYHDGKCDGWVDNSKQSPENGQKVLICTYPAKDIYVAAYKESIYEEPEYVAHIYGNTYRWNNNEVYFWCPIPDGPVKG